MEFRKEIYNVLRIFEQKQNKKMQKILIIALLISNSLISQSIGINDLTKFKTTSIGQIEETLILKDWLLKNTYENNRAGVLELLGNDKVYVFVLTDYYDNEIAKISITRNDKDDDYNKVTYSTENSELNKNIVLNLKRNNYNIIDTGTGLINMNFNPKVDDILVKNSFSKTYSNGTNEVRLATNTYVKVVEVDYDNYYTKEHKTVYELSL